MLLLQRTPPAQGSAPCHNAAQVHEARDGARHHRKQAECVAGGLAQNAKGFEPPNAMLDMDPYRGLLPICCPLRIAQLSPAGFALRRLDSRRADIGQVPLLVCRWKLLCDRTTLIEALVCRRSGVPRVNIQEGPADIRSHLSLERMTLLLARIDAPLASLAGRAGERGLESIDQHAVHLVG